MLSCDLGNQPGPLVMVHGLAGSSLCVRSRAKSFGRDGFDVGRGMEVNVLSDLEN